MALQLTGAYKHTSIANLQVSLPPSSSAAASPRSTRRPSCSPTTRSQIEKELERYELLLRSGHSEAESARMFDDEEWATLERHLAHAPRSSATRRRARRPRGASRRCRSCSTRGAASRSSTGRGSNDSPAYRLNHEEVDQEPRRGRAVRGAHVAARGGARRARATSRRCASSATDGTTIELPARTVCVAAGTSPNVIYEKEYPGTFELDDRKQYFRRARGDGRRGREGRARRRASRATVSSRAT